MDFDPNCSCIITTDMIETKKESKWDRAPFNALTNNLVRYLGSALPSLTLKTGCTTPPIEPKTLAACRAV